MAAKLGTNKLITNANMNESFQSEVIDLHGKTGYHICATFIGSPNGSTYLAVSSDNENWDVLPDSEANISAAGKVTYNVSDAHYDYVILHYVRTSGNGTLNASFNLQGGV